VRHEVGQRFSVRLETEVKLIGIQGTSDQ
jgi:UDP-N-acetylenolpyruvoylglucosamine reductase